MDDVRICSKCKIFCWKSNFVKDILTKVGLNPFCKICQKSYYNENFDKKNFL